MKSPPKKYDVGYGRPPKHARWKKGECGNPNRIRKRPAKPVVQTIDEFFVTEIDIVENGISRRVSNFEAILLQLWIKTTSANKRSAKVLLEYLEYARSRGDMGGLEVSRIIVHEADPEESGDKHE